MTRKTMVPHAERLYRSLETSVSLWTHPLLLPALLLQENLYHCEVSGAVREIEKKFSVTRTARLSELPPGIPDHIKALLADNTRRVQITSVVHSRLTDTITLANILRWNQRLSEIIKRADQDLHQYYERTEMEIGIVRELESAIEHFSREAVSMMEYVTGMKSRRES